MKLILAEKPSVAKDIAKAIGNFKEEKSYIRAGEYLITWAYGHLLEIDDRIAPQRWSIQDLPLFPEKFLYRPAGKTAQHQLERIKKLLKEAQEVQIWTDPGREGELIARLILSYCGWKGKTLRMWTSEALTKEVVLRELQNLKPAEAFDHLYQSALARQHADWIVGINLTRVVTLKAQGRELWSVGRVQTPTLALIVERDIQIENFQPQPYGIVRASFSKEGHSYRATLLPYGLSQVDITEKDTEDNQESRALRLSPEIARQIVKKLRNFREGKVVQVRKEIRKELPPLLHSLTSLQREANRTFGFTANRTLSLAQSLYEKGYISYPRSDARHLAESSVGLVKRVLRELGREDLIPAVELAGKRVFDDSKLTDHHAIIPLRSEIGLAGDEKKVYWLILRRFLGAFMPPYEYELTRVWTELGGYTFYTQGKKDRALGWKSLYKDREKDTSLPELREGDGVLKKELRAEIKQTKPPPHYTEETLLNVMERLHLGTPATRASIIETLKERQYVKMQGRSLLSTQKGKELIEKLKGSKVTSPELTGKWETELESIYREKKGFAGYRDFLEAVKNWTREEIQTLKDRTFEKRPQIVGVCPLCGGQLLELPRSYRCQACGAAVNKETFGKRLNPKQAIALLSGKEVLLRGLKNREGKRFSAYLRWQEGKIFVAKFANRS